MNGQMGGSRYRCDARHGAIRVNADMRKLPILMIGQQPHLPIHQSIMTFWK
jgi:hypothetical protein